MSLDRLVRRFLDAVAVRFSVAEQRLADLKLVTSPPSEVGSLFNPLWLSEFGISPRVILDIGSYDAADAVRLKRQFPEAKVFAFEADPDRFAIVEREAAAAGVTAVQTAIGDHEGRIRWYRAIASGNEVGGQGSMFPHARQHGSIKQVELPATIAVTRMDTFCRDHAIDEIDLAHIDVEGAEHEVLVGFGDLRPKMIFLEIAERDIWRGAKSSAAIHRLLSRLGYILAGDFRSDRLYIRFDLT